MHSEHKDGLVLLFDVLVTELIYCCARMQLVDKKLLLEQPITFQHLS